MNGESVFCPFGVEECLLLVRITNVAMSFLDSGTSGLPGEEVLVANGLNGLAVKMEPPFRLFLQLAFRDPAAVLKEMLFGQ